MANAIDNFNCGEAYQLLDIIGMFLIFESEVAQTSGSQVKARMGSFAQLYM